MSKWVMPAFSLALGLILLGIEVADDHVGRGLVDLAIMAEVGAVLLFGGRSEGVLKLDSGAEQENLRGTANGELCHPRGATQLI